ncbi:MAG: DUF4412 domain-containing protein [Bacteroidetes bacterium]|nr:DUF4412 domain-containing protein [Bacteroidota bacterium]
MKKLSLLLLLLVVVSQFSFAQNFEGTAVFKITYDLPDEMKGHEGMLPSEYLFQIKNEKSRMEASSMMGKTVVLNDNAAKTSVVLMEMMGQKMKMTLDLSEVDKKVGESTNGVKIQYVDGTKVIAGYTCKKAKVEVAGEGEEKNQDLIFYYTDEIAPIKNMQGFEGLSLKGMPLEFSIHNKQGIKMLVTATNIEKKSIDDSVFDIPEGYTEMPASMKQAMQQQK